MPNPFEDSDVDDEDQGNSGQETATMQQLRKAYNRMEKENKAHQTRIAELSDFQTAVLTERKEQALTTSFEAVGLNPKHAKLYQALNPEVEIDQITPEAVAAFAGEYSLIGTSGEVAEVPEPKAEGYAPVTTGTAAPLKKYSQEEVMELLRSGQQDELTKAYAEGRVQKETLPWR